MFSLMSITTIIIIIVFVIVLLFVQVILSKHIQWWRGIILPALSLLFSFAFLASYMMYSTSAPNTASSNISITQLVIFIPTIIFVAIYFIVRKNR